MQSRDAECSDKQSEVLPLEIEWDDESAEIVERGMSNAISAVHHPFIPRPVLLAILEPSLPASENVKGSLAPLDLCLALHRVSAMPARYCMYGDQRY
jgi:hypothetical protein